MIWHRARARGPRVVVGPCTRAAAAAGRDLPWRQPVDLE
uniref:Uncharacterized protein n=1 Tax=Arundo donax TaxID=35708 RepID=A0A0A9B6Q0_ARUDO